VRLGGDTENVGTVTAATDAVSSVGAVGAVGVEISPISGRLGAAGAEVSVGAVGVVWVENEIGSMTAELAKDEVADVTKFSIVSRRDDDVDWIETTCP